MRVAVADSDCVRDVLMSMVRGYHIYKDVKYTTEGGTYRYLQFIICMPAICVILSQRVLLALALAVTSIVALPLLFRVANCACVTRVRS